MQKIKCVRDMAVLSTTTLNHLARWNFVGTTSTASAASRRLVFIIMISFVIVDSHAFRPVFIIMISFVIVDPHAFRPTFTITISFTIADSLALLK